MNKHVSASCEDARFDKLSRLNNSWAKRSEVQRHGERRGIPFDPDKPDYLPELLPIVQHDAFRLAPPDLQRRLLTCGWLAFNQKAAEIERHVLVGACQLLEKQAFASNAAAADAIASALVDESYHVLLVQQASRVARHERELQGLAIPRCEMVERMWAHQATCSEPWEADLVVMASAIVTEVFISGYLGPLSAAIGVQPLHVATTQAHLNDERAHAGIFRMLGELLYAGLNEAQGVFFTKTVGNAIRWFAAPEWSIWESVLGQMGVRNARGVVAECTESHGAPIDTREAVLFLESLGVRHAEERLSL